MEQPKEYYAFISYKREDEKWAKWLANELEHYHLPTTLNGKELPENLRPIFRDTDELSAGNLPKQIYHALSVSKNLIVVCSPRSAKSEWVNKEITDFIKIKNGKADHIYPFIIEGIPFSKDSNTECLPKTLKNLPKNEERLGGNINEQGGRNAAVVKIIAGMLGIDFDSLWQKYEREQLKKRNCIIAIAIFAFLCISGIAFWMFWQKQQTENANWKMMENQARAVAEKAQALVAEGDSYTAQQIAIEVLPKDLKHPDRPYTQEAETALRNASYYNSCYYIGHTDSVNFVSYNTDETQIVTSSSDKTIKVWDVSSSEELYCLKGHKGSVIKAFFNPSNQIIVSASKDGTVKIWDTKEKKCKYTLSVHQEALNDLSISRNGKFVASSSNNKTVIWDIETGKKKTEIRMNGEINSIAFHPNGEEIVACSSDTLFIWDVLTGKLNRHIACHMDSVYDICGLKMSVQPKVCAFSLSPDGNEVVCSDRVGNLFVYDMNNGKRIMKLLGKGVVVNFLQYCNKNRIAAISNQEIHIWDLTEKTIVKIIAHHGEITSMAYNNKGTTIQFSSNDHTCRQISFLPNCKSSTYFDAAFNDFYLSPDHRSLATADFNTAEISIRNVLDGKLKTTFKGVYHAQDPSISNNGKLFAIVGSLNPLTNNVLNFRRNKNLQSKYHTYIYDIHGSNSKLLGTIDAAGKITFSPNDKLIACSDGSSIGLYDTYNLSLEKVLKGYNKAITSIAFSSSGEILASVSADDTLRVWDIHSGKPVFSIKMPIVFFKPLLLFSPDNRFLAITTNGYNICIVDIRARKVLHTLSGHSEFITSLCFNRIGNMIMSSSNDKTVKVWNVETGLQICTFQMGDDNIKSFFSPDDSEIIVVGLKRINTYDFPLLQHLINKTRERFRNRQLTPVERRKYYLE